MGCIPSKGTETPSNKAYKYGTRTEEGPKQVIKNVGKLQVDLAISPDQFIVENPEDIKKTYIFEKKLGEGKSAFNNRGIWSSL